MSEETITIKKDSVWKYSTFLLIAIFVVGAFVFFNKSGSNGNVIADNSVGTGDFSFISDSSLYPFIGSEDAKVTVIEFYDFQCPYCALVSGLPEFAKQYSAQYANLIGSEQKLRVLADDGKIRFVLGTMSFLGAESGYSAEAFICANEQEKALEMYDQIFTAHDGKENNGKYTKDKLKRLAINIGGLDQIKFASCLDSSKYAQDVQKLNTNANGAGVTGTPTFIINGVVSSGSWDELSAKLKSAGVSV